MSDYTLENKLTEILDEYQSYDDIIKQFIKVLPSFGWTPPNTSNSQKGKENE